MKKRFGIVCVAAMFAVVTVLFSGVSVFPDTQENGAGPVKKTLPRKYDIVKVTGKFLEIFDDTPINRLALLASKDGNLAPIPFQVDERDAKGFFVMTSGKAARQDDGGKLDANDELVFLGQDSGDRLPEKERVIAGKRVEIEIADPRRPKERAWVYLAKYDAAPPRSSQDYVRYDPASERIISSYAIVGYRKGFMFYNDLIYPATNGGNGKDFLDRIKFRIKVDFLGGKVPMVRSEEIVTASVAGWIDGPIRVIQYTENKLKILDALPSASFDGLSEYYPHMMSTPLKVRVPFDLQKASKLLGIRNFTADVLADMPGFIGGYAWSNLANPQGFNYTGKTPKTVIDKLHKKGIMWGYATKEGVGTWFPRLVFPDPTYQYNTLYMTDDTGYQNPPDDIPGEIGSGMSLNFLVYPKEIIQYIAEGSFELRFETYYAKPGLKPDEAREWLDIQDYPLFVEVHGGDVTKPTGAADPKISSPPWKGGRNGVITDTKGKKIPLKGIAFFIGSCDVDPRMSFTGERVSDQTFHAVPIAKMRSLANRYVDFEPVTKIQMAQFTKITMMDNSVLDLLGCKMCGWGGADERGRVIYLQNSQIDRIDF